MVGCAVATPPPVLAPLEAVSRGGPGAVSLTAAGGGMDTLFEATAVGGVAASSWQLDDATEVEGSGGMALRVDSSEYSRPPGGASRLGFYRLGVRHRATATDTLFVRAGAGGGFTDRGAPYATVDAAATVGHTFSRRVRVYAGAATAFSIRLLGGGPSVPTAWAGGQIGLAVRVAGALQLGVEGTALGGLRLDALAGASSLSLFGSVRYTFSGSP